jgi:hypothetical protein
VSLDNHKDFKGNKFDETTCGIYHRAFTITSDSFFFNPTTVNPSGDDREDLKGWSVVSLESFSLKGDKIHKFVERACDGIWPPFHEHVEVKYFGLPFPAHFHFEGFKTVPNIGPCVCLRVMSEAVKEQYEVPLTAIERLRVRREPFLGYIGMMDKPWEPVEVICNLSAGGWNRFWIKRVNLEGYAPQVWLAYKKDIPFERRVDLRDIHEVYQLIPMDIRVPIRPWGGLSASFIGQVELKWNALELYGDGEMVPGKNYKILGCTGQSANAILNIVDPRRGHRYTIPCEHISYIWFKRNA